MTAFCGLQDGIPMSHDGVLQRAGRVMSNVDHICKLQDGILMSRDGALQRAEGATCNMDHTLQDAEGVTCNMDHTLQDAEEHPDEPGRRSATRRRARLQHRSRSAGCSGASLGIRRVICRAQRE
jgi:hypothetical protein